MIDANARYETHLAARLLDFFGSGSPWHRGLWTLGTILTLRELLEAVEAVSLDVLRQRSVEELARTAISQAGPDPGMGRSEERAVLQTCLQTELHYGGMGYHVVRQLVADSESQYLIRWATFLRTTSPPKPERAARAIAAHLLDSGFSSDFLHRWWSFKLRHEPEVRTLADVIEDAHALALEPSRPFDVLVAFTAFTKRDGHMPGGWLEAPDVSRWLRSRNFDVSEVRQRGGILMNVSARDPVAAADSARERLERLAARVLVGSNREFVLHPQVWIDGEKRVFRLERTSRAVSVHVLERKNRIYGDKEYSRVDAAIELLEPLASGSPATAVTSGWAAFEALLSEPGNHAIAADRMAAIVACSLARAELTVLSYRAEQPDNALTHRLRGCISNRDRANLLAEEIAFRSAPLFTNDSDYAACERLKTILTRPRSALKDVEGHATNTFRRLYRQRNLVLHGGMTTSVALRASLRAAAPLTGAGMDRIAHAWYVDELAPLELAARARIGLDTIGSAASPTCVDLLGR